MFDPVCCDTRFIFRNQSPLRNIPRSATGIPDTLSEDIFRPQCAADRTNPTTMAPPFPRQTPGAGGSLEDDAKYMQARPGRFGEHPLPSPVLAGWLLGIWTGRPSALKAAGRRASKGSRIRFSFGGSSYWQWDSGLMPQGFWAFRG